MIVNQILNHVETGKLKIGDKLPSERELCKMFGVGRSSVREAIRALVVMGNLEVIQGKGTFLCKAVNTGDQPSLLESAFDAMPVFDLMEARQMLEVDVVRLAAERVDKMDIRRMHQAINNMAECCDDTKSFYEADLDFHNLLAESTGNLVISEMMKVIIKMVHNYSFNFMAITADTKEKTISSFRQIVQLVARGEGERAAEVMLDYLRVVDVKLKQLISEKVKEKKVQD
ncbi:MAG: FadR/GntR family transcriptional regulator [Dehalobacterium sp.]